MWKGGVQRRGSCWLLVVWRQRWAVEKWLMQAGSAGNEESLSRGQEMRFLLWLKGRLLWRCRGPCAQRIFRERRGPSESWISKKAASCVSSPSTTTTAQPHTRGCSRDYLNSLVVWSQMFKKCQFLKMLLFKPTWKENNIMLIKTTKLLIFNTMTSPSCFELFWQIIPLPCRDDKILSVAFKT